jgi:hypothetical protein
MMILEKILDSLHVSQNLGISRRNFIALETEVNEKLTAAHNTDATAHNDIRTQINSLDTEVDSHKLQGTAQIIEISRNLNLTGVQTIATQAGRKIKSMNILGVVSATKKQCIGFFDGVNGYVIYMQPTTTNYGVTAPHCIAFSDDATTNRTFGAVGNIQNGSFDITWTQTGTGATGTALIRCLVQYHD